MGKLYVGNTFIDLLGELKVGTANVQKIYAGTVLVFPQPTTTTTSTTGTPTTTTTTTTELQVQVDWGVDEQGSGAVQLIIKDNTNTELVNQESQGTGPITGTIYIPQSKTPYTATITVTAGTEVAQYRICNVTNSTEITYNSSVPTSDTYTVNPTPLHSSVYATYGNSNVPPACPV
jgi:hypothetical protein